MSESRERMACALRMAKTALKRKVRLDPEYIERILEHGERLELCPADGMLRGTVRHSARCLAGKCTDPLGKRVAMVKAPRLADRIVVALEDGRERSAVDIATLVLIDARSPIAYADPVSAVLNVLHMRGVVSKRMDGRRAMWRKAPPAK